MKKIPQYLSFTFYFNREGQVHLFLFSMYLLIIYYFKKVG